MDHLHSISYAIVLDDLSEIIKGKILPLDMKRAIQCDMTEQEQLPEKEKINVHSEMVDILSKVSQGMMKEAEEEAVDITKTI